MSQGRQNSADSSYGRSAGQAAARGLLLLLGAVVLGLLLLRGVNDTPKVVVSSPTTASDSTPQTVDTTPLTTDATGSSVPASTPVVTRRAPALVNVLVVNGSGKNRAASKVADYLKGSQYTLRKSVDANSATLSGVVYFNADFQNEASDIATLLGITGSVGAMPVPPPIKTGLATPDPYDILVVVDAPMADRFAASATGSGAAPTATAGPTVAPA
jgi:hypothetical protein